jgi:hypothetical protein
MRKAGRSAADTSFNRRLLRSMPADAFSRRLLRSAPDAFSRRLLKRSSGKQDPFARRLLRSQSSSAFSRRLLRSDPQSSATGLQTRSFPDAYKRRILKKSAEGPSVMKRQSLIPFPRTGKRSDPEVALPVLQDMESLQPVEDMMLVGFVEDDSNSYDDDRDENEEI